MPVKRKRALACKARYAPVPSAQRTEASSQGRCALSKSARGLVACTRGMGAMLRQRCALVCMALLQLFTPLVHAGWHLPVPGYSSDGRRGSQSHERASRLLQEASSVLEWQSGMVPTWAAVRVLALQRFAEAACTWICGASLTCQPPCMPLCRSACGACAQPGRWRRRCDISAAQG